MRAATLAVGSVPATVPITTPQVAFAKARRRAILRCHLTRLPPTPRSRSAEGPLANGQSRIHVSADLEHRQMDGRAPAGGADHARSVRGFPDPAQHQLSV